MSEIQRWRDLYMVEYYHANPDKLIVKPEDVTVEESQQSLMRLFDQMNGRTH